MSTPYNPIADDSLDERGYEETQPPQAQHSPLPWKLLDGAILSEQVNDYGNFIIVESPRRYADETTQQDEQNMKLIVASVNHADALAEALRDLIGQLTEYVNSDDCDLPDPSEAERTLMAWEKARQ